MLAYSIVACRHLEEFEGLFADFKWKNSAIGQWRDYYGIPSFKHLLEDDHF